MGRMDLATVPILDSKPSHKTRLYNPVNVVPLTILLTNTLSGETSDVLYQNLFGK